MKNINIYPRISLKIRSIHLGGLVLQGNDTGFNHLVVKIVTLASTFTDTGKHGVTTMGLSDVVNQFHNQYSFTDTSTTEET
jgi:hypothetical protein